MTTKRSVFRCSLSGAIALALLCSASSARATTYQVGPGRTYTNITDVLGALAPGDVVEVDGDATYPGGLYVTTSGAAGQPITFRGVRVNGKRPVISGGDNTVHFYASHLVMEGFD